MNSKGKQLYKRAKSYIPGGTQLLSKRPEMHLPGNWPAYYTQVRGVDVWDLDDQHYVDMSINSVGACILGAADPDVDQAVKAAITNGTMSTLNCPEEVELAELLCELHPWARKVRYARTGGEAMAMAVRIARAATGRDKVAFCGYHGWHDWYLAANLAKDDALDGHLLSGLEPSGTPRNLAGTALPFQYNHFEQLEEITSHHGDKLAAIVMEPLRNQWPENDFLLRVKELAKQVGAVLIFDEITAGWRLTSGGAHLLLDIDPDIAVFAKAISNGYPMAAVIGKGAVMEAVQASFISSTYWTERIGPAAALATIRKHRAYAVHQHLDRIGRRVQTGWLEIADRAGLPLEVGGLFPLSHFSFKTDNPAAARTLFTQEMLKKGFLATAAVYATFAHSEKHVDDYLNAAEASFRIIREASEDNKIEQLLEGPVAHSGFQRLT